MTISADTRRVTEPLNESELAEALSSIRLDEISAASANIIRRQATINIGTIGHVAHGKSTVVKAISHVQTVRFKNELERNITIKLGYANAKIFKCRNPECPEPDSYRSYKSDKEDNPPCERPGCQGTMELLRHVSFVDCPGHDILMATMLNGAAVMDAALLLVAANEPCPQPQTAEHLAAIDIMRLRNIIILQNKIDLVKDAEAKIQYGKIIDFVRGTPAEGAPIIPLSGQLKYNIEWVCHQIVETIPVPMRDYSTAPKMIIIRSFDVNRPGTEISQIKGGVAGGSIISGVLKVGDEIEVRPGIVMVDEKGGVRCKSIFTKVISLHAENNHLPFAVPGGLIGVGTNIDPQYCRADRLVGRVLGHVGTLPSIYCTIELEYKLFYCLLGVRSESGREARVKKLSIGEVLFCNIGSTTTGGRVVQITKDPETKKNRVVIDIAQRPACAEVGDKVALSRRIESHWRLIGYGIIQSGRTIEPEV